MSPWHKSSYSSSGDSCVEVNETPHSVLMRDTQNRELGHLAFPGTVWASFVQRLTSPDA